MSEQPPNSDRISTLPDEILSWILSFLPMKQVLATSVLSKKWKSVWRLVSTYDFDDPILYTILDVDDYARFVHSVLAILHHLHHPIHKLRLKYGHHYFSDHANVILLANAVAQRTVHHLDFSVTLRCSSPPINLSSIFSCKSLVVLKLEGGRYCKLEPISSVYLPSLQVLHLNSMTFSKRGCLTELLLGCPVLEDLNESHSDFGSGSGGREAIHRELKTLPKLLRADISTSSCLKINLEVINNVKFLRIETTMRRDNSLARSTDPKVFPMFHNLTHIKLDYISFDSYHDDWSEVVELIKHCPKLQVLVIRQSFRRGDLPEEIVYPSSMLHLKRCTEDIYKFARYVAEDSIEDEDFLWDWHKSTGKASISMGSELR